MRTTPRSPAALACAIVVAAALALTSTSAASVPDERPAPTAHPGLVQLVLTDHHRTIESVGTVERRTVAGKAVTLLRPRDVGPAGPVGTVIYFGGVAESAETPITDLVLRGVVTGLLGDGWEIAAISASPVHWGNDDATATYRALGRALGRERVVALAKSMGALASLNCIASACIDGIDAWAGIYPVTDQRRVDEAFRDQIVAAFGGPVPERNIPAENAARLVGVPMLLWASPTDTVVPADANGIGFAAAVRRAGGRARAIESTGQHGDLSHFDPDALSRFFSDAIRDRRPTA